MVAAPPKTVNLPPHKKSAQSPARPRTAALACEERRDLAAPPADGHPKVARPDTAARYSHTKVITLNPKVVANNTKVIKQDNQVVLYFNYLFTFNNYLVSFYTILIRIDNQVFIFFNPVLRY